MLSEKNKYKVKITGELLDLLKSMLAFNPKQRISVEGVLNSAWF
jgi:serine/threonine protein kinase